MEDRLNQIRQIAANLSHLPPDLAHLHQYQTGLARASELLATVIKEVQPLCQ